MEDGKPVDGSIWIYAPNKGAPIFFALAFFASGVYHAYQCIHYKSWRLTGLYVFCAFVFTAGFVAREVGAFNYGDLGTYIASVCLVYAAPPVFELANYHILGRILFYVPWLSPMHPGRVLSTFAFISFLVETISGLGASYSANVSLPDKMQKAGGALLKAALILQLFVVAVFMLLAGTFHHRTRKAGIRNPGLTNVLITLYISTLIVTTRTVYRVVEFFELPVRGSAGSEDLASWPAVLRYEWFFYFFEATLMLCNQWMMNLRHPMKYIPENKNVYLAKDGVTEITGPGYKDSRGFIMTVLDPFDCLGSMRGKSKQQQQQPWDEDAEANYPGAADRQQHNNAGQQHTGPKQSRSLFMILMDPFDWLGKMQRRQNRREQQQQPLEKSSAIRSSSSNV